MDSAAKSIESQQSDGIRPAVIADMIQLIPLFHREWERSGYGKTPISNNKLKHDVRVAIKSPGSCVFVSQKNGVITGICVGSIVDVFGSNARAASTILLWTDPDHPGNGGLLLKRYINWAKEIESVSEIVAGYTSGVGDAERVEKLFNRLKLVKTGSTWTLEE